MCLLAVVAYLSCCAAFDAARPCADTDPDLGLGTVAQPAQGSQMLEYFLLESAQRAPWVAGTVSLKTRNKSVAASIDEALSAFEPSTDNPEPDQMKLADVL